MAPLNLIPFHPCLLLTLTGGRWRQSERINAVNDITIDLDQTEEESLTYEVSDEALEIAAGTSAGTQGGSSLWSSFTPAGCTCLS